MLKKFAGLVGMTGALSILFGLMFFVLCIGPIVTWVLFNYIAPIFNWRQIHFPEAFALFILVNILTGGIKASEK